MDFTDIVLVGLAGSIGAAVRFVVDGAVRARVASRVPVGTIVINLTGSFLLGVLTGLVLDHGAPSSVTLVAGTGFCGGYTTFSTSTFETVRLVQEGELGAAALNGGATLAGTLVAAAAGLALVSL